MPTLTQQITARLIAQWNALIPKCAKRIVHRPDGVLYLHPTKGWRRVSYKRLGLA